MAQSKESKLNVVVEGKGAPIVLLHGFPFDHHVWRELSGAMGERVRLITPDLAGFGESPPLDGQATMDAYADAVAEWMREEGLNRFALAGHSMGGYIALAFARRHTEMLSALILVCTRSGPDTDAAREGRYKLIADVQGRGPQAVVDAMLPKLFSPQTAKQNPHAIEETRRMMLRQSVEGITAALAAMAERPDSTPSLNAINVPTVIITGADDAIIPAAEGETMRSHITGARHMPIEGAGHMPMLEKPNAFNDALKAFAALL